MEMTIPIYVEALPQPVGPPRFRCQPLFAPRAVGESVVLGRAMSQLAQRLKKSLDQLGRLPQHDALAAAAYHPVFDWHTWRFHLDLHDRTLDCRYLFVVVQGLGRRVAFTPKLPELWIDIADDEDAYQRTAAALEDHFRGLKSQGLLDFTLRRGGGFESRGFESSEAGGRGLEGKAWVTTVDLDVSIRQPTRKEEEKKWALLWDESHVDGEEELDRVGRCLDLQYPDDLQRAVGRDADVARLMRLLSADDRRPLLLIGRRLAGKTTLLHECVWRRVKARKKQYSAKQNVWLISPGRLISGMSYVGQWENRWLAILDEAKRRDHVLYLDDLLGMYHAGVSRDSELCAADVLKPRVRRRELRLVAEMTPEALHVFQERDRGFADEFQILRVEETGEAATLRVLLEVGRRLEARHRCRFSLDVLPAAIEVQRRYVPAAAFPGKAARMLTRLAVKHAGAAVDRGAVLREFHEQTGLQLALLDTDVRLPRERILERLQERMVGQEAALEAAADTIGVAKARLNSPDRPLGVLLFLGPTGVGKTECAKAIARYLYGDADRLLRLDMNEFVTAADAARLVGARGQEDGLLTGPVRRRPFCVVLLDEIEKAHGDVHNLLLQLTGEGRLTDALGRTADFSGAIVVLTSNLGTREAARSTGFATRGFAPIDNSTNAPAVASFAASLSATAAAGNAATAVNRDEHHYIKAAERFFSPELFNRFDRVIPFRQLSRDELGRIAEHLMRDVLQRDGLIRRRALLHVDPRAMQRVIDEGHHPRYGARALKRAVERRLARPVARQLAGLTSQRPIMVRVFPAREQIACFVDELLEAERVARVEQPADLEAALADVGEKLHALDQQAARLKPAGGISVRNLTPRDYRYFALHEQLETVKAMAEAIARALDVRRQHTRRPMISPSGPRGSRKEAHYRDHGSERQFLVNMHSTDGIDEFVEQRTHKSATSPATLEAAWVELHGEAALLEAMAAAERTSQQNGEQIAESVIALFRPLGQPAPHAFDCAIEVLPRIAAALQLDCRPLDVAPPCRALALSGAFAELLLRGQHGLHLLVGEGDELSALQCTILPCADSQSCEHVVAKAAAAQQRWLESLEGELASLDARGTEPFPLGRVVRVIHGPPVGHGAAGSHGPATMDDLRTGITLPIGCPADQLRRMLVAALNT